MKTLFDPPDDAPVGWTLGPELASPGPGVPLTGPTPYDVPGVEMSHSGDPPTSAQAAAQHVASGRRDRHKALVLALVKMAPGLTACEVWAGAGVEIQTELREMQEVRRRLTDLLADGAVRQGPIRKCRVRKTRMVTWAAV